MNPSPPHASTTSGLAAGASDAGRRVTALAAGGSVLLLSATAVVVWPRTYGAEATFVLDAGAKIENPVALAGRIEASLLEREQLASAAMDLPPELRSPDPIGRLRAGIRVQSRNGQTYVVEFRGSNPQSVQRIANRLADRAVLLVPTLTAAPEAAAEGLELAQRTRAVTTFLAAHPEVTIEQLAGKSSPTTDGVLDLLYTERRQIERKLATGATDNPYADPGDDPAVLSRRLAEIKGTIARREATLRQPKQSQTAVAPEVQAEWRALLADLAAAQEQALSPNRKPPITARVTARATLPRAPLTPNRLVLSVVAALLTAAAAMVAYVLPRKTERSSSPRPRSEPPPKPREGGDAAPKLGPALTGHPPGEPSAGGPPFKPSPSDAPPTATQALAKTPRSDAPPPRLGSEPPGAITAQRTVVLTGGTGSDRPPAPGATTQRRRTSPGGLEAPQDANPTATGPIITVSGTTTHAPPAGPLFGSRPPPGAGTYSVSSSPPPPPPPPDTVGGKRAERSSPLQSAQPPRTTSGASPDHVSPSSPPPDPPQILSRPPALDPDAERWASRFETVPPPDPEGTTDEEPRKRSSRWKTQVMGSMVPLEVAQAREGRTPSEPPSQAPREASHAAPVAASAPPPPRSTLIHYDVPPGWRASVDLNDPQGQTLRDAVLQHGHSRQLTLAVTGDVGRVRAEVAAKLAFALSQAGSRVLLLEADFDQPQLHAALALDAPAGSGFSQQLTARRHDKRQRPWAVVRCAPNLAVLAEGRLRSPGQLLFDEFERAVHELAQQHHLLVLHAPGLAHKAELRVLRGIVDGVVFVQAGSAPRLTLGKGALALLDA